MSVGEAPDSYNVDSDDGTQDIAIKRGQRAAYSDATRYLSCGAELNEDFALGIIRELFAQPKRAVAPSYGIDVVPIVKHALRGRRRRAIRDIALMVLLLPLLVFFPIPTLAGAALVVLLQVANLQSRLQGRVAGIVLALAGLAVAIWWLSGQSNQIGRALRSSVPASTSSLLAAGGMGRLNLFLVTLLAVLVLAVVIWYGEWHFSEAMVGRTMRDDTFEPNAVHVPMPAWMKDRLDEIDSQQYGEMTLFESRVDLPFVGAGLLGRWWSFAVNLHPRASDGPDRPAEVGTFTPADLHRHIEEELLSLRKPEAGLAYGLPGFEVSERLCAPGWYRYEGQPPHIAFSEGRLTRPQVERIINGPADTLRHWKCLRSEWQGREMVATTYLHLAMEGRTLYVEFTPCVMSPIKGFFKNVDNWNLPKMEDVGQVLGRSVTEVLGHLFGAPRRLARAYWIPYLERLQYKNLEWRQKNQGFVVDYGARTSVREMGSLHEPKNYLQLFDPEKYVMSPRRYMQLLDAEKYTKTIEAQMLDAILEFLESHRVDTTEFRTRRAAILDSRVFVVSAQGDIESWGQRPVPQ